MNEALDMGAKALTVIGGLNWGLVGLLNMDLVQILVGAFPPVDQIVYGLVGLSALYVGYNEFFMGKK